MAGNSNAVRVSDERDANELTMALEGLATMIGMRFVVDQEKVQRYNLSQTRRKSGKLAVAN